MNDRGDLYRRMLWDAQKIEDKKLARLVQKRLSPHLKTKPGDGNNIIPFPVTPVFCTEAEPAIFWKEHRFWQGLMQLFIVLGIAGAWFFMPFIKIIISNM